jgi:hypothetical protein
LRERWRRFRSGGSLRRRLLSRYSSPTLSASPSRSGRAGRSIWRCSTATSAWLPASGDLCTFRVANRGSAWWPWAWEQEPHIRVSYHWRTLDGEPLVFEGVRSSLPARLDPGESQIVPVWVEAPAEAGRYLLEFDLVHEHVRWFESPLVIEMEVADRPA